MGCCCCKRRSRRFRDYVSRMDELSRRHMAIINAAGRPVVRRDSLELVRETLARQLGEDEMQALDFEANLLNRTPSWISFQSAFGEDRDVYVDDSCPVCMNPFGSTKFVPRLLPCGHLLCNTCVITLSKEHYYKYLQCPQDRKKHKTKSPSFVQGKDDKSTK